jgi:hypothetical protein
MYPVHVSDMGGGVEWDNFPQVLYTFWIHYTAAEGLTRSQNCVANCVPSCARIRLCLRRSHDVSRQVLLYLFHGCYQEVKKNQPTGTCVCICVRTCVCTYLVICVKGRSTE